MRILASAAAAATFMFAAASAQTTTPAPAAAPSAVPASRCGEVPAAPTAPDGATASQREIQTAIAAYDAWRAQITPNLECRRAEALEMRAIADARTNEFNAANAAARDAGAAFQAASEAYNARHGNGRQR
jgi:hypothetical protein